MQIRKLAKFRVCPRSKDRFGLSNIGEWGLVNHMKGKEHTQHIQDNEQDSLQQKLNSFSDKVIVSNEQRFSNMTSFSSRSSKIAMDFVYDKKNVTNTEIAMVSC